MAALSFNLLIIPLQIPRALGASTSVAIKTADQYRAEAARFNTALNAIRAITTMKLETGADLKKAIAILDHERDSLRFRLSKYVTMGLSDSTFSSAVKKRATNRQVAEEFVKQLQADPKLVTSIEGATSLRSRIEKAGEADAATLRLVSDRLKDAAERIKKAARTKNHHPVRNAHTSLIDEGVCYSSGMRVSSPQLGVPVAVAIIIIVAVVVVMSTVSFEIGRRVNPDLEADVAACQQGADQTYRGCVADARDLPSGFPLFLREAAVALCYSQWLATQAFCITIVG